MVSGFRAASGSLSLAALETGRLFFCYGCAARTVGFGSSGGACMAARAEIFVISKLRRSVSSRLERKSPASRLAQRFTKREVRNRVARFIRNLKEKGGGPSANRPQFYR